MTPDQVMTKYVRELDAIYVQRTKGSYTWQGLLGSFLHEMDAAFEVDTVEVRYDPNTAVEGAHG